MARQKGLTASVSVLPRDKTTSTRRSKDREWQHDSFRCFHQLGEVRASARVIGNRLARCRFYVGKRARPGGVLVPLDEEATGVEADIRDLLLRIKGRDGTFESLVRTYGAQQFVAGEDFLVGEDGLDGERWEFLSTSEISRVGTDSYTLAAVPDGSAAQPLGPNSLVLRFWQRDIEFRERADAPLRSVLDLCDALIAALAIQTAGDRSRLAAAGLLLMPSDADLPKAPVPDGDEAARPHLQLLDDILAAMEAVMADPGSAHALIPIMVEIKGEFIEKAKHLTFARDVDQTITERINHLINRLAMGLDLPPEVLLGVGKTNHWNSWEISQDLLQGYIAPMAAAFCEDMTVGYLIPAATEARLIGPDEIGLYGVGFDLGDLVQQANQTDNAKWAFDALLLGGDTTLEALGYGPDQRMIPEEMEEWIRVKQALNASATAGQVSPHPVESSPTPAPAPAPSGPLPAEQPAPAPSPGPTEGGPPTTPKGPPANEGPPAPAPPPAAADIVRVAVLAGRMAGACDVAVERAVERAGARLRTKAAALPEYRETMATADVTAIPALLGVEGVGALAMTVDGLMEGAWTRLAGRLTDWTADPDIAARLVAGVDRLARRRLFDPTLDVLGAVTVLCEAAVGLDVPSAA